MGLLISEEYVNRTKGSREGSLDVYESFTDDTGELYRSLMRQYGRCTGRVYVDTSDGGARAVGWVFLKRSRYEDSGEPFLLETWVTLHERKPKATVQHFYKTLG